MFALEDLDAFALAVDEQVLLLPQTERPARLFGVRRNGDGFALALLWAGAARELPRSLVPPPGLLALALDSGGWAAPMNDDGSVECRPSRHPERQRMHHTAIVTGDGIDVSVLRRGEEPPMVLRGAVGYVFELLVDCWDRRAA